MDQATDLAFDFVTTFNNVILFPTIALMSALALLLFLYGCFVYIINATDPTARQQGIRHITWGIVGLVVMMSAYTLLLLFASTFGLGDELGKARDGEVIFDDRVPVDFDNGNNAQPVDFD